MALKPLPPPSVSLLDPATGLMAKDWYDYFRSNDQFARASSGTAYVLQSDPALLASYAVTDAFESANVNHVSWTPSITFVTPGSMSIGSYTTQSGKLYRVGWLRLALFSAISATFNKGSASGNLLISGLPDAALDDSRLSNLRFRGLAAIVGFTQFVPFLAAGSSTLVIERSGPNSAPTTVVAGDLNTGNISIEFSGAILYAATYP
jgi:hypothetical protein